MWWLHEQDLYNADRLDSRLEDVVGSVSVWMKQNGPGAANRPACGLEADLCKASLVLNFGRLKRMKKLHESLPPQSLPRYNSPFLQV